MIKVASYTFNPFQENTYVLSDDKGRAIIIDPGMYFTAENERMDQCILREGLTVQQLINTHCHIDHIFSVERISKQYSLPLGIHPAEKEFLDRGNEMASAYGLNFEPYTGRIYYLREDDKITLGDDELLVIEAPGHSPGSVCFYCEKQKFLIAGDVLFRESIGRTDLPGGSHTQLINSIQTKIYTLPDDVVVYSGHGPTTTVGHEKKHNPFITK